LEEQELNLMKQNPKNQTSTTASRPIYTKKLKQGLQRKKKKWWKFRS
jgi:hypothetical protein